jgi:Xaa-Pro aminopeptidase
VTTPIRMHGRFEKILERLNILKVDALLLNSKPNVSYAAGFSAADAYLLATKQGMTLVTDFRYAADFKRYAQAHFQIRQYQGSIFKTITRMIKDEALRSVGFESRHLTFAECQILNDLIKKSATFIPCEETLEPLREIKEEVEIKHIKEAVRITLKTYDFIEKKLKAGITELEVAAEIERFIRLQGAQASAFETIVASGPNSSYPHAAISRRSLRNAEPVIIDMGVEYNGYKCDLTRTFFLGKIPATVQQAARIVRRAQAEAIQTIRPGRMIKEIDARARHYIARQGFGENFGHALGHGIGLEVHESPSINKKNQHRVKVGMVFTVEPGIYLPGKFGIRMEEMVLVTRNGVEVLSGHHSDQSN